MPEWNELYHSFMKEKKWDHSLWQQKKFDNIYQNPSKMESFVSPLASYLIEIIQMCFV